MSDNKRQAGSIIKFIGIVLMAIILIAGLFLGKSENVLGRVEFDWVLICTFWVSGLITGTIIYSLGLIVELLVLLVDKK